MKVIKRILSFIGFVFFYAKEVVLSNLRVAHDVLTPSHHMKPGIIHLPVENLTDRQLLMMANLVTMTPGTLCLQVSDEADMLYIHAMYIDESADALRKSLKQDYERRIRNVF